MTVPPLRAGRPHLWFFVAGCMAVTIGVLLHVPMFWMGRDMGFHLADMPMDAALVGVMGLIVAGIASACYGLLPRTPHAETGRLLAYSAPEDAPLTAAHWR